MWSTVIRIILTSAAVTGSPLGEPFVYDQRQTGKTNVRVEVKDAVVIAVGDGEFGGDYDYSYDYSDLTIKPPSAMTSTKEPSAPTRPSYTTRPQHFPSTTVFPSTTAPSTTLHGTTSLPLMKTSPTPGLNSSKIPILLEAENNSIIFPSKKPDNASFEGIKLPPSQRPDTIPILVLQELLGSLPYKFLPAKQTNNLSASRVNGRPFSAAGTAINPETLPRRNCSPGYFLDNHNRCKRIVPKANRTS